MPNRTKHQKQRITRYVRRRLRAETQTHGDKAALSRALGLSHAHISNVINNRAGIGPQLLDAVCEYWGITTEQLRRLAAGAELQSSPYPNLETAIDAFEHHWSPATVARLRSISHWPQDRPVAAWVAEGWELHWQIATKREGRSADESGEHPAVGEIS